MTLEKAIEFRDQNLKLIGEEVDGRTISEIFISPSNGDNLGNIVSSIYWEKDYHQYLQGQNDFEVNVLFDMEDFANTGVIFRDLLSNVLNERGN